MFWVIFDTSTKRAYYRDVHNLLALPPGATIRYDYNEVHLSAAALAEAQKADRAINKVLVAYAQDKKFKKGDADPEGPIPYEQALWIGTRIARLGHLRHFGNRYFFDLQLGDYPTYEAAALEPIMRKLAAAGEVPFSKWVALSDLDIDPDSLARDKTSANWTSVIDALGTLPSQFAGDSFWRVAKIASGWRKTSIEPLLQNELEAEGNRDVQTGVQAVYPISELARLALEIESRVPESGEEPRDKEPETARTVTFSTESDGPLRSLNGRSLELRRYATEWIKVDVGATDRAAAQEYELMATTGPAAGAFPIGPELRFKFQIEKQFARVYFGILLGIASALFLTIGGSVVKDHLGWGILSLLVGLIAGLAATRLLTGRLILPGAKAA
jgi:hypothetical protein